MMYTETDIRLTPDEFQTTMVPKLQWTRLKAVYWSKPSFCPPILDDMMPDINRLMHSVASRFCDQTTPQLQADELLGQARLKLSELITKDHLLVQENRECFFKFLKSALNNQARSLVQKYRFTEKRTGVKPPPRHNRVYKNCLPKPHPDDDEDDEPTTHRSEYHKNVELSLDDEQLNLQVPDRGHTDEDRAYDDMAEDYLTVLNKTEKLVFTALIHPSYMASKRAELDARVGKQVNAPLRIRITHEHIALDLGMKLSVFEEYVLSIRQKIAVYRAMSDTEHNQHARRHAILSQLNEVFGLQIPPDTDDMLVRRILTIAARDQFDKLKDSSTDLAELLEELGAKVPRLQADKKLGCYGVLYQRSSRVCAKCDLRKSCAIEAANVGLGKIILSPRLLGSHQPRTPAILPRMSDEPMVEATPEDLDWLAYLRETFTSVKERDGWYFYFGNGNRRGVRASNERRLFFVSLKPPYRLRFIKPSETIKNRLVMLNRSWYAPEQAASIDIQSLIDQHTEEQTHANA